MKKFSIFAVPALVVTVVAVAYAATTFDPATGTGSVAKGQVQELLETNNAGFQAAAEQGVQFTYTESGTYQITCQWVTGEGTPGEQTHTAPGALVRNVNSEVEYSARGRNQIAGWHLTGYDGSGVVVIAGGCTLGEQVGDPVLIAGGGAKLEIDIDNETFEIWPN
jgi:hypothetical protein